MSGSVVTSGSKSASGGKRGTRGGKENTGPNKSRRAAKAKAKASATNGSSITVDVLPAESNVDSVTIECSVGVRSKLWVDDLLSCVRHAISSIKNMNMRSDLDLKLLQHDLIRIGLLFAFQQQVQLNTGRGCRPYRKWSALRPALKEYALFKLLEDGVGFQCLQFKFSPWSCQYDTCTH